MPGMEIRISELKMRVNFSRDKLDKLPSKNLADKTSNRSAF